MNFNSEGSKKYEIPRANLQPKISHDLQSERVIRAIHRVGKNRGKRINGEKANEIRDLMDRVGQWSGW